jgi:hypothetical protein
MMLVVRVDGDDAPKIRKLVTFPRKLVPNTHGKEYEMHKRDVTVIKEAL